jgi:hypothetical protein
LNVFRKLGQIRAGRFLRPDFDCSKVLGRDFCSVIPRRRFRQSLAKLPERPMVAETPYCIILPVDEQSANASTSYRALHSLIHRRNTHLEPTGYFRPAPDRARRGIGRIDSVAIKPRTNHQSRVDWWRAQFQSQPKANLSVTDLCRQLGVSVTTFSYGKKRVDEAPPDACGRVPGVRPWQQATTAAHFVPLSIIKPEAGAELEIELTNACMVRLKGVIDPLLLQAAITAAGPLDGSRQGAN